MPAKKETPVPGTRTVKLQHESLKSEDGKPRVIVVQRSQVRVMEKSGWSVAKDDAVPNAGLTRRGRPVGSDGETVDSVDSLASPATPKDEKSGS